MYQKLLLFGVVSAISFLSIPSAATLANEIRESQLFKKALVVQKLVKPTEGLTRLQKFKNQKLTNQKLTKYRLINQKLTNQKLTEQNLGHRETNHWKSTDPAQSNTYYNPQLWSTYLQLQDYPEKVITRSAMGKAHSTTIAVYVGAQTIFTQHQQPLGKEIGYFQENNGTKLAKDTFIFLHKHGYLQYLASEKMQKAERN